MLSRPLAIMVLPAAALYTIFMVIPLLQVGWLSLFAKQGLAPEGERFVGLSNYEQMLADAQFWDALSHNVLWTVATLLGPLVIGFGLAALLAGRGIRGRTFYRVTLFVPVTIPQVIVGIAFIWIYQPEWGLLNTVLRAIGLGGLARGWLGDFDWALPAVLVAAGWSLIGFFMIIFLAGMQKVNPELYDSAKLDGATPFQEMTYVTVPALRPEISLLTVLAIVVSFSSFDIVAGLRGGPGHQTQTLAYYIYKLAFGQFEFGYAAAVSVILTLVVFVSATVFIILRGHEH